MYNMWACTNNNFTKEHLKWLKYKEEMNKVNIFYIHI